MRTIYCIGGSPCSGKSTLAKRLSEEFDLAYFTVDDKLDAYILMGKERGLPACTKIASLTPEANWMRDPDVQNAEELAFYREAWDSVRAELTAFAPDRPVVTEGAAYLPELIAAWDEPHMRYLALTPTKVFQCRNYAKREWVPHVLEGCSDQKRAFDNWMDRDALFADEVRRQCGVFGCLSLMTQEEADFEKNYHAACEHFGLLYPIREYAQPCQDELLSLYQRVGWTSYTKRPEMLMGSYRHSLCVLAAYHEDKPVGLIRAVGDGHSILYIQDLLVQPDHQLRGIGARLVRALLKRYPDCYQTVLLTDDTDELRSFYGQLGFRQERQLGCTAFVKMTAAM